MGLFKRDDGLDWIGEQGRDRRDAAVQFKRRRRREMGVNLVRWSAFGCMLLLVAILYALSNPTPAAKPTPATDLSPYSKTAAWRAVEEWLGDGPLGASARVVSWDGTRDVTVTSGHDTVGAQVDSFTVDAASGWWHVEATVDREGTLLGWPTASRLRLPSTASPNANMGWTGVVGDMTASDAASTLASQWGKALMGDDSDLLGVVVKDPDPSHAYQALGLGEAQTVAVEKAAYLDRGRVDANTGTSSMAVMRVTVALTPPEGSNGQPRFTYDVLVSDPDGSPRILAWGAPGTGPKLNEYANRLPDGVKPEDVSKTATDASDAASGVTEQGVG